ncbi:hypothetical protein MP228_005447 [Amoeboaphelidium protococcarum]|nr:hypothetical protein MP228_012804 [Amoeboaphelidium protococcarum]KAI3649812.1 hypothetical protein MP228_005444 [Amoeboaphelidium protococcarum]KAI3649815.1 hypothetical protein MP228_005447 [Amoeboaphelidium protococcarum]
MHSYDRESRPCGTQGEIKKLLAVYSGVSGQTPLGNASAVAVMIIFLNPESLTLDIVRWYTFTASKYT